MESGEWSLVTGAVIGHWSELWLLVWQARSGLQSLGTGHWSGLVWPAVTSHWPGLLRSVDTGQACGGLLVTVRSGQVVSSAR